MNHTIVGDPKTRVLIEGAGGVLLHAGHPPIELLVQDIRQSHNESPLNSRISSLGTASSITHLTFFCCYSFLCVQLWLFDETDTDSEKNLLP